MKLYRARGLRGARTDFNPLDASGSISGPKGWRFNDLATEILYTAEVEALAILEVAIRPGIESLKQILIASIEIPDDAIVNPRDLNIVLPRNWNARPVADDSRTIAREFLEAIAKLAAGRPRPVGLRVPSVLSSSDYNVLLDPRRKSEYRATMEGRIPFNSMLTTGS